MIEDRRERVKDKVRGSRDTRSYPVYVAGSGDLTPQYVVDSCLSEVVQCQHLSNQ